MDEIDQAQANDEFFRESAISEHFRKRKDQPLEKAEGPAANGRTTDGAGGREGICIGCGEEIEPARLAAQPNACRCVACQGKFERRR